jgi:hypothetical protein
MTGCAAHCTMNGWRRFAGVRTHLGTSAAVSVGVGRSTQAQTYTHFRLPLLNEMLLGGRPSY